MEATISSDKTNFWSVNPEDNDLSYCNQQDKTKHVSYIENYIEVVAYTITSAFGLFVLYKVVIKRRYWDFFAITVPLLIVAYGGITIVLYSITGFNDLANSGQEDNQAFRRTYWFYAGIYNSYHWLCAIQYLSSSFAMKMTAREAKLIKEFMDDSRKKIEPMMSIAQSQSFQRN